MPKGGNGGDGGGAGSGIIQGNKRDNILTGTSAADTILGAAGNDTLFGLGGDDFLDGGTGDDLLDGGMGNDSVDGGQGNDTALLSDSYDAYVFEEVDGTTIRIIHIATGEIDVYSDVETFQFSDRTLGLADVYRGPDLAATSLSVSTTTWAVGNVIDFSWLVANVGDLEAAGTSSGIYLSTDAEVTTDDLLLTFDAATGMLAPGGTDPAAGGFAVDFSLHAGTYYLAAIADMDDVVVEADETNNTTAPVEITVLHTPAPDLAITASTLTDTSWAAGDLYQIRFTVTNEGDAASGVFLNRVYVSEDAVIDAGDTVLTTSSGALAAGESQEFIANRGVTGQILPGDYHLLVRTDDANAIAERDEADNTSVISTFTVLPLDPPNLLIDQWTINDTEWVAGDSPFVNWRVRNSGLDAAAAATTTALYLSADATLDAGDLLLDTQALIPLAGGQYRYQYADFTVPDGLALGTYHLFAAADDGSAIAESDEADNVALIGQITIAEAPNLAVSAVSVNDTDWGAGDAISVAWSLDNAGGSAMEPSTTRVYLSTDQIIDGGDLLLGGVSASALAAGNSLAQALDFAAPTGVAPGSYYLGVLADAGNDVAELDETDNTAFFAPITIPDPAIYGTEGADVLTGTGAADTIRALGGDDIMIWTPGGDLLNGGAGFDRVDFSSKTDFLDVFALPDPQTGVIALHTGDGDVLEEVEALTGTGFADIFDFTAFDRALSVDAGAGADQVFAGEFDDAISGGDGGDFLVGGGGNDLVSGDGGDDILAGLLGNDAIWTGAGADTVVFLLGDGGVSGDGADTVHDFDPVADLIYVEYAFGDPAPDLFAALTDTAEGVRIDYAADSSILMLGVTTTDLNAGNLIAVEQDTGGIFV